MLLRNASVLLIWNFHQTSNNVQQGRQLKNKLDPGSALNNDKTTFHKREDLSHSEKKHRLRLPHMKILTDLKNRPDFIKEKICHTASKY
jgi:hypothetical protein